VKLPFHVISTWTDGRSAVPLTSAETNVPVDASKFDQPCRHKAEFAMPNSKAIASLVGPTMIAMLVSEFPLVQHAPDSYYPLDPAAHPG
jgi:hypothetical protein